MLITILGWSLWLVGLSLAVVWGLGIRTYVRNGQSVTRQTVTQAMLFAAAVVAVPILGVSPFHLCWMLPVGFVAGALSLIPPFSLLWVPANLYGKLWCFGIAGTPSASSGNGKWNLVRQLAKRRVAEDPFAQSMGFDARQLDSLALEQLAGLPESTVVTIVETYAILRQQGVAEAEIFERIEAHRAPVMGSGDLPRPLTLESYTRYRVKLENQGASILDRFVARATEEARQHFGL